MLKMIDLVPAASEVILRLPEAVYVFVRNGRPCPVWNGSLFWAYRGNFDAENDRPGPSSLRGHFEAARSRLRVCPEWSAMPCMEWLPVLGIQG